MNDVFVNIRSRRTVHEFTKKPVEESTLMNALDVSTFAPNHKLTNPWRFLKIGPQVRKKITEIAVDLKRQKRVLSKTQEDKIRSKMESSPELIVVLQNLGRESRRKEDYAACACLIQNLSLALWSEGIGSKWSTGAFIHSDAIYELLNLEREQCEIVGAIFIGYPVEKVENMPRRALSELLNTTE